jgi:uncharacterized protein
MIPFNGRKLMRICRLLGLTLVLMAVGRSSLLAQVVEVPPLEVGDSVSVRESVRTLAERATSVHEDADPVRYLGNLARLQLASGEPAKARGTLDSLRSLPDAPGASDDPDLIALEIHLAAWLEAAEGQAESDAAEGRAEFEAAEGRVGFDTAYGEAFREAMERLTGTEVLDVTWYLETPGFVFENRLEAALDRLRGVREMEVAEAVTLIHSYLSHRIHAEAEPLLTALIAEEEHRRYDVQTDVLIETPEGATLSAIVVRDRAVTEAMPTALTFTIYADTAAYRQRAMAAAAHGYVGVAAFSRGKHLSTDVIRPYEHEVDDTHAVLDWISRQPWSDGRVGMYGGSYDGFAAWAATKRLHPALKTIVPWVPAIPGYGLPMENNVFLNANYGWAFFVGNDRYLDYATYNDGERWGSLNEAWYRSGRSYREIDQVDGAPNPHLQRWLRHPAYDEYWQAMVPHGSEYERIDIPILSINGYFDDGQNSAVRHFEEHYAHNPDAEHFLLIGPYDHFGVQARRKPSELRGYTVDPVARFDTQGLTFQWLDHVLKGGPRPELIQDRVNYQVMGANRWEHAPSIAAMGSETLRLHLTDGVSGEHFRLANERPAASGTLEQLVDLGDRTSERNSYYPFPIVRQEPAFDSGLSFISEPFDEPVTVSGSFSGSLQATSNKRDLDFHVVLFEVRPDGTLFQLSYHLGRASFAQDMSTRRLLTPGRVERLPFARTRLVSRELQEGSRLLVVLDVNKDSFHQVNHGTGRDVSDESIGDAHDPLEVRWHTDSYVEVPVRRRP